MKWLARVLIVLGGIGSGLAVSAGLYWARHEGYLAVWRSHGTPPVEVAALVSPVPDRPRPKAWIVVQGQEGEIYTCCDGQGDWFEGWPAAGADQVGEGQGNIYVEPCGGGVTLEHLQESLPGRPRDCWKILWMQGGPLASTYVVLADNGKVYTHTLEAGQSMALRWLGIGGATGLLVGILLAVRALQAKGCILGLLRLLVGTAGMAAGVGAGYLLTLAWSGGFFFAWHSQGAPPETSSRIELIVPDWERRVPVVILRGASGQYYTCCQQGQPGWVSGLPGGHSLDELANANTLLKPCYDKTLLERLPTEPQDCKAVEWSREYSTDKTYVALTRDGAVHTLRQVSGLAVLVPVFLAGAMVGLVLGILAAVKGLPGPARQKSPRQNPEMD